MEDNKTCPKCHRNMTEGFVIDRGHLNSVGNPQWTDGEFVRSFWTGGKIGNTTIPVRTFRCPACGYLESYATPQPE